LDSPAFYLLAADAILLLHVLFVVFIVLSLLLIFAGNALAWHWVRNPWFRLVHLIAIAVVVVQSWLKKPKNKDDTR
jgi:4-hydroxybenzoate polyprenyltransferase